MNTLQSAMISQWLTKIHALMWTLNVKRTKDDALYQEYLQMRSIPDETVYTKALAGYFRKLSKEALKQTSKTENDAPLFI